MIFLATLTRNPIHSKYGTHLEKRLTMKVAGKTFREDLSEFPHSEILIAELKKHCQMKEFVLRERKGAWVLIVLLWLGFAFWVRRQRHTFDQVPGWLLIIGLVALLFFLTGWLDYRLKEVKRLS